MSDLQVDPNSGEQHFEPTRPKDQETPVEEEEKPEQGDHEDGPKDRCRKCCKGGQCPWGGPCGRPGPCGREGPCGRPGPCPWGPCPCGPC